MLSSERKEQIRKRAEILSKADGYQLLLVKAYQDAPRKAVQKLQGCICMNWIK